MLLMGPPGPPRRVSTDTFGPTELRCLSSTKRLAGVGGSRRPSLLQQAAAAVTGLKVEAGDGGYEQTATGSVRRRARAVSVPVEASARLAATSAPLRLPPSFPAARAVTEPIGEPASGSALEIVHRRAEEEEEAKEAAAEGEAGEGQGNESGQESSVLPQERLDEAVRYLAAARLQLGMTRWSAEIVFYLVSRDRL